LYAVYNSCIHIKVGHIYCYFRLTKNVFYIANRTLTLCLFCRGRFVMILLNLKPSNLFVTSFTMSLYYSTLYELSVLILQLHLNLSLQQQPFFNWCLNIELFKKNISAIYGISYMYSLQMTTSSFNRKTHSGLNQFIQCSIAKNKVKNKK